MSLSKVSRKQAAPKHSSVVQAARATKVEPGRDLVYGVTDNIAYNSKLRNLAAKPKAFNEPDVIVLTVNPKLDKIVSTENDKAATGKQMFADYRNKK